MTEKRGNKAQEKQILGRGKVKKYSYQSSVRPTLSDSENPTADFFSLSSPPTPTPPRNLEWLNPLSRFLTTNWPFDWDPGISWGISVTSGWLSFTNCRLNSLLCCQPQKKCPGLPVASVSFQASLDMCLLSGASGTVLPFLPCGSRLAKVSVTPVKTKVRFLTLQRPKQNSQKIEAS